jgi:RNA polymerase sigma-70 factor (ECF subfamily)
LLVRIQDAESQAAWVEFLSLYEPFVYRFARRKGFQDADAQDLCQEVFRRVACAVKGWTPDPERGTFRGWLVRITHNLVLNQLRGARRHVKATGDSNMLQLLDALPDGHDEQTEELEREYRRHLFALAAEAIEKEFTRSTWEAFWKTSVDGASPSAVAAELSISVGAVYIARSRVLARLRQKVQALEGHES